jgi:hypothetical protein
MHGNEKNGSICMQMKRKEDHAWKCKEWKYMHANEKKGRTCRERE